MRTNSRGCLSCQTGRAARARPPARIPLDFRGFQWVRVIGRGTTRRRREVPCDLDIAFTQGVGARGDGGPGWGPEIENCRGVKLAYFSQVRRTVSRGFRGATSGATSRG